MKKTIFLVIGFIISIHIIAQNNSTSDTCLPPPWVEAQLNDFGIVLTWGNPCDTCQVVQYSIAWIDGFNPCVGEPPEFGTFHHRTFISGNEYHDWSQLLLLPPNHKVVFAVKAIYEYCESDWTFSNTIIINPSFHSLEFSIELEGGEDPIGTEVSVFGSTPCTDSIVGVKFVDNEGYLVFEDQLYGLYNLQVSKLGYQTWTLENFELIQDTILQIELQKGSEPAPSEFQVSSTTGLALWTFQESKDAYPLHFKIYLGDSLVAEPDSEKRTYQFQNLENTTDYTASISTLYEWGETEWVNTTFTTYFLGVDKYDESTLINIYPNPANKKLNIDSKLNIDFTNIRIVNQLGQEVFSTEKNVLQIDISGLDPGIYIVELEYFNKLIRKKIVVK